MLKLTSVKSFTRVNEIILMKSGLISFELGSSLEEIRSARYNSPCNEINYTTLIYVINQFREKSIINITPSFIYTCNIFVFMMKNENVEDINKRRRPVIIYYINNIIIY